MFISEKLSYTFAPVEDKDVENTAKNLDQYYRQLGYTTKVDISSTTITVTATRYLGLGENE